MTADQLSPRYRPLFRATEDLRGMIVVADEILEAA